MTASLRKIKRQSNAGTFLPVRLLGGEVANVSL